MFRPTAFALVLALVIPSAVALPPPDPTEVAADTVEPTSGEALAAASAGAATLDRAAGSGTHDAMNETARLLADLNATLVQLNAALDEAQGGSNATRALAIGRAFLEIDGLNQTITSLRSEALATAGQPQVSDDVNATTGTVVVLAKGAILSANETIGRAPGTARGATNASVVGAQDAAGATRARAGLEANATRALALAQVQLAIAQATLARDTAIATLRASDPSASALVGVVGAASGDAVGLVAGTKNATIAPTANMVQQTAFGHALATIRLATAQVASANQSIDTAARQRSTEAREAAFSYALLVQSTLNSTVLDLAVQTLTGVDPTAAGEVSDARNAAFGLALARLEEFNTSLAELVETALAAKDDVREDVDGAEGQAQGANAAVNTTREDAFGPQLDTLIETANATRRMLVAELAGVAAQAGIHALQATPSAPQTLAETQNVPILRINHPDAGDFNSTPLVINFTTNLPMPAGGPGFEAAFALPGVGVWNAVNTSACTGDAGVVRTCHVIWPHAVNALVNLRVTPANATVCYTGQCGAVNGVTLDTIAPTTVVNASQVIPLFQRVGAYPVNFTTEPGATVTLRYTKDGGAMTTFASLVADASGDARFTFTPATNVGVYRLFAAAVDRAGNVEAVPGPRDATLHVIDSLLVTVGSESLYFKNGDDLLVQVCVQRGAEGIVAGVGNSVEGSYDGGPTVPFQHVSGCLWERSFGPVSGVVGLTKFPLTVSATNLSAGGDLVGAFSGDVTLTPTRLVALSLGFVDAWVPAGGAAMIDIEAVYNDTGEPADLVEVVATGGDAPITTPTFGGTAGFQLENPGGVGSVTLTFSAQSEFSTGFPSPVFSLNVAQPVVWTRLVGELAAVEDVANNSDVGDAFTAAYRLTWEHSPGLPAVGAEVDLTDTTSGVSAFSTGAGGDGIAIVSVSNATVSARSYTVNATYDTGSQFFITQTGLALDVNFTRVAVSLASNFTLANVGTPFDFEVEATFVHDGLPVPGAIVEIRAADDPARVLDTVTTGADGVAFGHHTFGTAFDADVTARLTAAVLGVSQQATPIGRVPRIVSTQVALGPVTVDDRDVHPGESVRFSVSGSYSHNGSSAFGGTVTLTPLVGDAVVCGVVAGASECDVTRASVFSGPFTVTIATNEGITSILGGAPQTPVVNWTRVDLSVGTPLDALVDVGATIRVPVTAVFAHDGARPVAGATVVAHNATGVLLGSCSTSASGACDLDLTTLVVYSGVASLSVTSGPSDITQLASPVSTGTLTWTRLLVDYTVGDGPFARFKAANFGVTVRYAHNNALVQGAIVGVANFSVGTQSNSTDATGETTIPGIESQVGTRTLAVYARLPSEGITANATVDGLSQTTAQRWTAIGFRSYTYSPAPSGFDENGEPIFPTNTAVTVCAIVIEADTDVPLVGATVTLRGVSRVSDAAGQVCITIAANPNPRNLSVTAHGVSATIGGKTINASIDRRVVLHFVTDP